MIGEFFAKVFGDNAFLATFLISLIPLIELKGAIPFGTNVDIWNRAALSATSAFFASVLGGVVVTIILAICFKPLYNFAKDKRFFKTITNFFTQSVRQKSDKITNKSSRGLIWKKLLVVFVFVAIPVPGTGFYTGTIFAIFLGLNFYQVVLSVTAGNVFAGLIITLICSTFPQFTTIILITFLCMIAIYFAYRIIVAVSKNKYKQKS